MLNARIAKADYGFCPLAMGIRECDCHLRSAQSRYCHTRENLAQLGGVMWFPTQDEAVQIYARFLEARHGRAAAQYARKTAKKLQAKGDLEGYGIWSRVADVVDHLPEKSVNVESVMEPT